MMGNVPLAKLAMKCATTFHVFGGVWSANIFPKRKMPKERKSSGQERTTVTVDICKTLKFQIVNSSPSNEIGEHWLLFCLIDYGNGVRIFVWVCLGRALSYYDRFHSRLWMLYRKSGGLKTNNLLLKKLHSNLCSLISCTWFTTWSKKPFDVSKLQKNLLLMQTTELDVVRFFNEQITVLNLNLESFDIFDSNK